MSPAVISRRRPAYILEKEWEMSGIIRYTTVTPDLESVAADLEKTTTWFANWLNTLKENAIDIVIRLVLALIIWFVGKRLLKFLLKVMDKSLTRMGTEITVIKFLKYLGNAAGYVVLVLMTAGMAFGRDAFNVASLMTLISSAGIALGLALQGTLSNFAGGVLILFLKPFRVGDYIVEDNHKNEGTVRSIGLVYTELTTIDNKIIVIPNGTLSNSSLTNVTAQGKRRLDLTVGISYNADIKKAKQIMLDILNAQEETMKDEEITAFVSELADSSVVIGCRAWVPTDCFWPVKWRVTEAIKLAFDEAGVEIPFNQLDVHVRTEV